VTASQAARISLGAIVALGAAYLDVRGWSGPRDVRAVAYSLPLAVIALLILVGIHLRGRQ
jgi:hypothetical protein